MTVLFKHARVLTTFFIITCAGLNWCEAASSGLISDQPPVVSNQSPNVTDQPAKEKPVDFKCVTVLKSNCAASQIEYLETFLSRGMYFGLRMTPLEKTVEEKIAKGPIPLQFLPKDEAGRVNWAKAIMDGLISPRDSISEEKKEKDKPFDLIVVYQVGAYLMGDVLFPHSVHNYWLSCKNCHPRIFKPEVGGNPVTMKAIREGRFCGECHGKVAFPFDPAVENCRRCHSLPKLW